MVIKSPILNFFYLILRVLLDSTLILLTKALVSQILPQRLCCWQRRWIVSQGNEAANGTQLEPVAPAVSKWFLHCIRLDSKRLGSTLKPWLLDKDCKGLYELLGKLLAGDWSKSTRGNESGSGSQSGSTRESGGTFATSNGDTLRWAFCWALSCFGKFVWVASGISGY